MVKKQKSKARLDKFYYMAKEQGFRSRAAYKLIQLNKKYEFLSKAKCIVDLCAAPGGWLQVAAKYMPMASIKIGVDLVPIKPIKGCITFAADITTPRCVNLIKKELKHFKADAVLNDGAPNVGAEWSKDAFNQAELSLHAFKLATEVLRKGGMFITKVFRSKDYNSLLYVLNQFFSKVEATKPQASRMQSAEIFVVCTGYKAPDTIDPKFLDPKYAFAEVEDEAESSNKVTSLKKLIDTKRNRGGYGDRETLYQETDLSEFLECADPYQYLQSYNKFIIDEKAKEIFQKIAPPKELELICQDLKVLGRAELFNLLKYRQKYQHGEDQKRKKIKNELNKVEQRELNEEEKEALLDKELEDTIKRVEKEKKRADKKDRLKKQKTDLRHKMSVIASTDLHNENDEVLFDRKTLQKLKNVDIEDMDYEDSEEDLDEREKMKQNEYNDLMIDSGHQIKDLKRSDKAKESEEEDEYDSDAEIKRMNRMNEEIEGLHKQKKDYQLEKDKKLAKKEKKRKALLEQQRQKMEDVSEEEQLDNEDVMEKRVKFNTKQEDDDDDSSDEDDSDLADGDKPLFLNPLLLNGNDTKNKKKPKIDEDEVSEGEWSSEEEEKKKDLEKKAKKESLLGKRKKRGDENEIKDFFKNEHFEVVPQDNLEKEDGYESLDSDDIAETRALAKLMLRKKTRNEILDSTYNKFVTHEDKSQLPSWFNEDEDKHFKPFLPVTKEMVAEEKKILKEYNERPSKKVAEAKARKKRRLGKAMNKVKAKAQVIADTQDMKEGSKMRQIEKLYKKEKNKQKEDKKYVVNRNFSSNKGRNSRNVKMVDKRLKKDVKSAKRLAKKNKGKKMGKSKGIKK